MSLLTPKGGCTKKAQRNALGSRRNIQSSPEKGEINNAMTPPWGLRFWWPCTQGDAANKALEEAERAEKVFKHYNHKVYEVRAKFEQGLCYLEAASYRRRELWRLTCGVAETRYGPLSGCHQTSPCSNRLLRPRPSGVLVSSSRG